MQSLEMFVGKNVEINVSLKNGNPNSLIYQGRLTRIENEVCVFSEVKNVYGKKLIDYSNNVVINKQYIIMIAEM